MNKTAYIILRQPVAMSLFGHGLVRIPKMRAFSEGMVTETELSILPAPLVLAFGYAVPIIELITGLLLVIGLFTRETIYVSLILMAILVFGSTTIESFGSITSQLVHSLYLGALLYFIQYNTISVDHRLRKQRFLEN